MLHRMYLVPSSAWTSTLKNVSSFHSRVISVKDSSVLNSFSAKYITSLSPYTNFRTKSSNANENSSLSEVKENSTPQLTLGEKVKQTTKDVSYLGVIIAGIGITGITFYAILRELFSGQSSNTIYTEALKLCQNEPKLVDILGEPIKGYGELTARGRRRHVSHVEYIKDDKQYMRMKFYIEGSRNKGTVYLEMKQGLKSKYEYRYLFVDIKGYPPYIMKDNRHEDIEATYLNL